MSEIHDAVVAGDLDQIQELVAAGADLDRVSGIYGTPLFTAAAYGYPEIFERLLAEGADPNTRDRKGRTPIFGFVSHQNKDNMDGCLEKLLLAGADVTVVDDEGDTVLMALANRDDGGMDRLAAIFIEAGVDINHSINDGWSALSTAVFRGRENFVRLLVDAGAHIDAGRNRVSLLHTAARYDAAGCAKVLIDAGANVDAEYEGETPLDWAKSNFSEAIFPLLSDGAEIQDWVKEWLVDRDEGWVFPLYVKAKEALDGAGEALFVKAVEEHGKKGADYRFANDFPDPRFDGMTLLHIAVGKASVVAVQALLDNNADLTIRNSASLTAEQLARNFTRDPWLGGPKTAEEEATPLARKARAVLELLAPPQPQQEAEPGLGSDDDAQVEVQSQARPAPVPRWWQFWRKT